MKKEGDFHIADRRLYLTADKSEIVEHGDLKATTLYAVAGDRIPEKEAARYGLVKAKAAEPAEDKSAPKSADKGAKRKK